jgi:BASS family bile acid:Na+ symporter
MGETLAFISKAAMLVFLLAGMFELGLSLTFAQILDPWRNTRLAILSLMANFFVVPLLAVGIARLMRVDQAAGVGLLLLGMAPGAPFIPKVVQLARGDLSFAVGLMVFLMLGTVLLLPWVLPLLMADARVNTVEIEESLILLMLLPLLIGLSIHALFPDLPSWVRTIYRRLANLSAIIVVVLVVAMNGKSVLSLFGTGAVFAGFLFVMLSTLVGWLLGGHEPATRAALGLGTGLRNIPAALLVAAQNFKDPQVSLMVVVTALISLVTLFPLAIRRGRRVSLANSPNVENVTERKLG